MKLSKDTMEGREFPLLPEGVYRFEIANVVRAQSSSGNMMYQLRIKCTDDAGHTGNVFDNLVETQKCEWRFHQFFNSIGMDMDVERDTVRVMDSIGEVGKVHIKIEQNPGYKDKNIVDYYLPASKEEAPAKQFTASKPVQKKKPSAPKAVLPESNDDLPF